MKLKEQYFNYIKLGLIILKNSYSEYKDKFLYYKEII